MPKGVARDSIRRAVLCGTILITALALALGSAGCKDRGTTAVQIPFVARIGNQPFSCSSAVDGFVANDLRFYVHAVELYDADGKPVPVALNDDGAWQSKGVALVDFENGADNCANGTSLTHTTLEGRAPRGDYRGLEFTIGVP